MTLNPLHALLSRSGTVLESIVGTTVCDIGTPCPRENAKTNSWSPDRRWPVFEFYRWLAIHENGYYNACSPDALVMLPN